MTWNLAVAKVIMFCGFSAMVSCAVSPTAKDSRGPHYNKTYVITGASSGFGRGVAIALASEGANVVLAARRTNVLKEVAAEVRAAGGVPLVVTTDVGKPADVTRLAEATVARFGKCDVWINNAGVGVIGPFENAPLEDYSKLIDTNLKGVVYGSQVAVKQFIKQGYGVLVNVGSIDSEVPLAYQAVYSATKAGVLSLDRALNEELRLAGRKQIKVATIMPWAVDTHWWNHAANYSGRAPRMAAMDDPSIVIDAIIKASINPKEEMPVGWKARASYVSHRLAPDFTESFSANVAYREMLKAGVSPATTGSLHTPMSAGTTIGGGVRDRMAREDRAN